VGVVSVKKLGMSLKPIFYLNAAVKDTGSQTQDIIYNYIIRGKMGGN